MYKHSFSRSFHRHYFPNPEEARRRLLGRSMLPGPTKESLKMAKWEGKEEDEHTQR